MSEEEEVSALDDKVMLIPVLAAAVAAAATAPALAAATGPPKKPALLSSAARRSTATGYVDPALTRRLRSFTGRWEIVIGRPHARSWAPLNTRRALVFWRRQARYVRRLAAHPPHMRSWLCIHRFEGSWNDSGDPYWGGLQMDRGFMRRYAPRLLLRRGWADHWTFLEQIWVAERAHRSGRGFAPWLNTARACGLV
jgi:hypothetical protein